MGNTVGRAHTAVQYSLPSFQPDGIYNNRQIRDENSLQYKLICSALWNMNVWYHLWCFRASPTVHPLIAAFFFCDQGLISYGKKRLYVKLEISASCSRKFTMVPKVHRFSDQIVQWNHFYTFVPQRIEEMMIRGVQIVTRTFDGIHAKSKFDEKPILVLFSSTIHQTTLPHPIETKSRHFFTYSTIYK